MLETLGQECRVCGCTDEAACPPGCSWAPDDGLGPLCSLCERLSVWWDEDHWYPFVDDENANITGPGHQDRARFAEMVNDFDRYAGGLDEGEAALTASDVAHLWVQVDPVSDERLLGAHEGEPGAFAVTAIWGVR